jgi:hypothetical protein
MNKAVSAEYTDFRVILPEKVKTGTLKVFEVKRPGRGLDHPLPPSAEFKERVELYFYSTSGSSWPVIG